MDPSLSLLPVVWSQRSMNFYKIQVIQDKSKPTRVAMIWLRGAVSRQVQFILFNFASYSPSMAMELKVSNEITCKWQNQRSVTKLQAAGINFEKLLGWTVYKNSNFNPFQSSSVLSIHGICCFCYVILTFHQSFNMLFSHVKISSFRTKACLVFHWCL